MVGTAQDFLVRFADPRDPRHTVGMGFVIGSKNVLTCAHVINALLGRDLRWQEKPESDKIVMLHLPMCGNAIRAARVEAWSPPSLNGIAGGDIAGLVITGEQLPAGLRPANLSMETPYKGKVELFGYPDKGLRPDGAWVTCQLRLQVDNGLVQLVADTDSALRPQPGYSGAPVLDETSGEVVAMFNKASVDPRYPDSYAIGLAALRDAWNQVPRVLPLCPYKSLVAFDEKDYEVFVGREKDVARLEREVRRSPVVLVSGPSGVGKSSLVQAGLLPLLHKTGTWTVTRCRPGLSPFQRLAAALLRAEGRDPDAATVWQREAEIRARGLADLGGTIHIAQDRHLLVFVDQLEELFAPENEPVVEEFLEAIMSLLTTPRGVSVVATVRADFSHQLLKHSNAAARLDDCFVSLFPLGADELCRVVEEPAKRRGVEFAQGLVERIVRDARAEASALPLLEFTLNKLWPRQCCTVLTHEGYEEIGRLEGGLRTHAESVITALIEKGTSEATLRGALLALISHTGDRMAVARRACPVAKLPADQQVVINALAKDRLVTTDIDEAGRRVAELAHEFLLHAWPRMVDLARDDTDFLRWRGEVERWQATHEDPLPEPMIAEASRWCEERPEETEWIHDLVERSEAEQYRLMRKPEEAPNTDRTAERYADALRLAAQAELVGRRSNGMMAMLTLAAESLRALPTFEGDAVARRALGVAIFSISHFLHNDTVWSVVFSPDGTRVATASRDRMARVFDATSGTEQLRLHHQDTVWSVVFSPDGTRVATASDDATARVFDATSGTEQLRLHHDDPVWSVVFSPDGTRVATASRDGTVRVSLVDSDMLLDAVERRISHPLTDAERERYGGRPFAQCDAEIVRGIVSVDEKLLAAVRQSARLRGQTVSQFVEKTLRRELTTPDTNDRPS